MALRDIPLFATLSDDALQRLQQRLRRRQYEEGEVILRAGDPARELHVVVEGAARVELGGPDATRRTVLATAGQTLGEMSVLSNSPVSATVVAHRAVVTLSLGSADLAHFLEADPSLYRAIATLLIDRLRHRTDARAARLRPAVALLALDGEPAEMQLLASAIGKGVAHYAPGSQMIEAGGMDAGALARRIERWRDSAAGGQHLVVAMPHGRRTEVLSCVQSGDAAVRITAEAEPGALESGAADARTVLWSARPPQHAAGPWADAIEPAELAACREDGAAWKRTRYPALDRVARFITYREIGVALSVGAAGGFAHLGCLEVLEDCGVPIDYVCGSSMGGAVALCFGALGTAPAAADALCRFGTEFARSRGLQVLPRSGLVSQQRMQQIAEALFGRRTFADLARPVAVVAADLVAGDRVVMERGPIATAARATVAIPGLLPPVRVGNRMLVDGGLVTRVPTDLLAHRRCGLRIASVVVPRMAQSDTERDAEVQRLQARLEQPFGFRAALGAAWKLVGWRDAAAQAQRAEIVIRTGVQQGDGFDFSAGRRIAELGRDATRAQSEALTAAAARLLSPGVP